MKMPWITKKEPCGGIVGFPTDKQGELERRLEKAEEELRRLHETTYGDKTECHETLWMKYNGETKEFTFGSIEDNFANNYWVSQKVTRKLPPVSQEEAMELAEFILDNYKGDNK